MPQIYTGQQWTDLLGQMDARHLKKAMRSAVQAEARRVRKVAQASLAAAPMQVRGNAADWKKGIRTRLYPSRYGLGFLATVKAHTSRSRTGEVGMHQNRQGLKKPILMWAEDGTKARRTKTRTKVAVRQRKAHATGSMPAYRFLEKAEPEMFRAVEEGLTPALEKAVDRVARKCGFI